MAMLICQLPHNSAVSRCIACQSDQSNLQNCAEAASGLRESRVPAGYLKEQTESNAWFVAFKYQSIGSGSAADVSILVLVC